ncbi:hypothetical protein JAAARDRAFT_194863 [Jaapia argillacea MUCL 33604]|uniref:Uncharacterized protein n=1 Tax=Jaapia argillacea MUCL 33604 TaxID=933084 RepID=A0A067Q2X1_9AGAM|nr:hypothetical protein JAAARDRAFT_194863 [Jaapia argillacea MUCL 33604]
MAGRDMQELHEQVMYYCQRILCAYEAQAQRSAGINNATFLTNVVEEWDHMNEARNAYAALSGGAPPIPRLIQSFDEEITSEPAKQNFLRASADDPRIPFMENTPESIPPSIDLGKNRWWEEPKPTHEADPDEDREPEIDVPLRSVLKESTSESLPGFARKKKASRSKGKGKSKKVVIESPNKKLTITIPRATSVESRASAAVLDARVTSVGAQSDAAMSDGAVSEATTDFTIVDQSDTEGMYNHVLTAKEKAKITVYQLHRGCTNNNTITKLLLTAEELEELTVQMRRSKRRTQKSRKMTQEASPPPPPKPKPTRCKRSQSIVSATPAPPQKCSRKTVVSQEYVEVSDEETQPGPSSGTSAHQLPCAASSSAQVQPVTDLLGELAQLRVEIVEMRQVQSATQATLERLHIDHGRVMADNEGIKAYIESVQSLLQRHPVQPSPAPHYMPPPGFVQTSLHTPMHPKTSHGLDSPSSSFSFEPRHQLLDNSQDWDLPQPTPSLTPQMWPEASTHRLSPVPESPNPAPQQSFVAPNTTVAEAPLEVQPTGLATSPKARTDVSADIPSTEAGVPAILPAADILADVSSMDVPTAELATSDIPSVVRATPSLPAEVLTLVEGAPTSQAEFPPITRGTPAITGADFPLSPQKISIPLTSTLVRQVGAPNPWVSPILPSSTTPVGSPPIPTLLDVSAPRIIEPPAPTISPIASPSALFGRSKPLLTFGANGQPLGQPDITMDDG